MWYVVFYKFNEDGLRIIDVKAYSSQGAAFEAAEAKRPGQGAQPIYCSPPDELKRCKEIKGALLEDTSRFREDYLREHEKCNDLRRHCNELAEVNSTLRDKAKEAEKKTSLALLSNEMLRKSVKKAHREADALNQRVVSMDEEMRKVQEDNINLRRILQREMYNDLCEMYNDLLVRYGLAGPPL